jgi:hypothetical protein
MLSRFALASAVAFTVCGCAASAPERASDIQNLHGISDDISAVNMTQSNTARARDPNLPTTLPNSTASAYTP